MIFIRVSLNWETIWFFMYAIIFCVGAGFNISMFFSDGLGPNTFRQKMERTRPMREEMDGKVFISRQSWHFFFSS